MRDPYTGTQRKSCFEGTRLQLLNQIQTWISNSQDRSICVLDGVAGIGKSTVAKTAAELAAVDGTLGASFFFLRDEDKRKTVKSFFLTLAYYLSCRYPQLAVHINKTLARDPGVTEHVLSEQFNCLIAEPLQTSLGGEKPILLVIDALDECDEDNAMTILSLFARCVSRIPRLRIFVTARPEQHIETTPAQRHLYKLFHLHDIDNSVVEADIRLYINARLSKEQVQQALPRLPSPIWEPTPQQKDILVGTAGKLFMIAATTVDFILDRNRMNPAHQLVILLHGISPTDFLGAKHNTAMDPVYVKIIRAAAQNHQDGDWVRHFHACVGTIVLLRDPLPYDSLAVLTGRSTEEVIRTLSNLHSLLAPCGDAFRIHHKSFLDFISDPDRCKDVPEFRIDLKAHHLRIAKRCLRIMNDSLRQNFCNLKSDDGL